MVSFGADEQWALWLLGGRNCPSGVEFLSDKTTPTEDEARAALARLLMSSALGRPLPRCVAVALAAIFDADKDITTELRLVYSRKAVFKNRGQGRENLPRDIAIALFIQWLRNDGMSYNEAASIATERYGLEDRQVKRIYKKVRDDNGLCEVLLKSALRIKKSSAEPPQGAPRG
jgi:hypothetical protein